MATVKGKSEGKSMFLKEYFVDHPGARKDEINGAWREAGNEGTISDSLVKQVRAKLGLTGRGKAESRPGAGKPSPAPVRSEARPIPPESGGRGAPRANGRQVEGGAGRPATPRQAGPEQSALLLDLESRIDNVLLEIRRAGGLPEFEESLRKARRILARSHGE